jgi:hypothetical protein
VTSGNIIPMIEVPDTAAARAAGGLPAAAWDGLDLARARGRAARLTLCVGWRVHRVPGEAIGGGPAGTCPGTGAAVEAVAGAKKAACPACEVAVKVRKDGALSKHSVPSHPGRDVPAPTQSLALRVRGLLWLAWERRVGSDGAWTSVGGQVVHGGGTPCTQTQAFRILESADGSA